MNRKETDWSVYIDGVRHRFPGKGARVGETAVRAAVRARTGGLMSDTQAARLRTAQAAGDRLLRSGSTPAAPSAEALSVAIAQTGDPHPWTPVLDRLFR